MSNRYAKYGFANRAVSMTIALIAFLLAVVSISSCKSSNNRTASLPEVAVKTAPGEGHAPATGDPFSHPAMQPTWARTARSDAPWKYPGSTTRQVLKDLRNGDGKPPPDNTPWEYFNADGHGWLEEETDLSRVAMQELSRRDKLGLLSAADQREIDQLALAGLNNPITAPGQFYIRQYLGDRWMTGKLPADEAAQLYKMAIRPELVTDPVVMEPDEVLLRLRCNCSLPTSRLVHWDLLATYKSICIDGKPVRRPDKFWRDSSDPNFAFQVDGYATAYEVAKTPLLYSAPGRHQIEVKLQIDIRLGGYKWPEQRPILFSEVITLNSEYREIPPTVAVKVFRFIRDPLQEGFGYLPTAQIQRIIEHPQIGLAKPAMAELMRRGRSAHATAGETQHLVAYMLDLQGDRSRQWIPEYGDYIESLHEQHTLQESQWKQYGAQQLGFFIRGSRNNVIRQGDPLPFEFVQVARRGNSRDRRYTGAQWKFSVDFSDGVKGPVQVGDMHMGIDHDGDEYPIQDQAAFASATLGVHTMRAKLIDYDLTWTARPEDLVIPTHYDCGEITFTVVPKTFDVILKAAGDKKIQVIEVVRTATGLGLKEATDLVEGAPKTIKQALSKQDAEKLKKTLEDQGAMAELK